MSYFKKKFYKLIKKSPASMPMVKYWKYKDAVPAKITRDKQGHTIMKLEGEEYPIHGFPRAHLLFGSLSKLKHEIKNQVFNESWAKLEQGIPEKEIISDIKGKLFKEIPKYVETLKYDVMPPNKMCPAVREIHRAWTKVSPETAVLRDYLTLILQEDDGYRFRVQWIATFWKPRWFRPNIKAFEFALKMLEIGEVVGDMKERMRLLRRILLLLLKDQNIRQKFDKFCKELDWSKVVMSEADKYHFRGKYFKVDLDLFEY